MKRTYIITSIQNGAYLATPEDQFEYGNKHQRSNLENRSYFISQSLVH